MELNKWRRNSLWRARRHESYRDPQAGGNRVGWKDGVEPRGQ